mgnify:CR=1 FL=1
MKRAGRYLSLIKFEHTVFALPFALLSLLVAAEGALLYTPFAALPVPETCRHLVADGQHG